MKIPDYINITEKDNSLTIKDTRTNLVAKQELDKEAIKIYGEEYKNSVIGHFIHALEHKYNKSLPIEKRKGTNTPTDFTCPHCFTKDNPEIIKKPKIGRYRTGIWYARREYTDVDLQNVYKCTVCKNEFTQDELNNKKFEVDKTNKRVILFEQLQDKIITDEEYQDKRFEIEMGITKQQYEAQKEKEKKEYNSFGNRLSNSIGVIYQPKNLILTIIAVILVLVILSIQFPESNRCEKFGDDWKYSVGYRGSRNACINSNGDIKYIQ